MRKIVREFAVLSAAFLLLVSAASAIVAAGAHEPGNAAADSDIVVHGEVSEIRKSGEVGEHHPVTISVDQVFKGDRGAIPGSGSVTVQVQGDERTDVSTAAEFSEGEEVVVMLEERKDRYYMTTGYATKYSVENGTVRIPGPEPQNMTLSRMESIVANTTENTEGSVEGTGAHGFNPVSGLFSLVKALVTGLL